MDNDHHQIYANLIKKMLSRVVSERPSIEQVLVRPMFWEPI
jgi:hypothetical protein